MVAGSQTKKRPKRSVAPQVGFERCEPRRTQMEVCVVLAMVAGSQTKKRPKRSVAPQVGFEPTTYRLTAERSTTELLGHIKFGRARLVNLYRFNFACASYADLSVLAFSLASSTTELLGHIKFGRARLVNLYRFNFACASYADLSVLAVQNCCLHNFSEKIKRRGMEQVFESSNTWQPVVRLHCYNSRFALISQQKFEKIIKFLQFLAAANYCYLRLFHLKSFVDC